MPGDRGILAAKRHGPCEQHLDGGGHKGADTSYERLDGIGNMRLELYTSSGKILTKDLCSGLA